MMQIYVPLFVDKEKILKVEDFFFIYSVSYIYIYIYIHIYMCVCVCISVCVCVCVIKGLEGNPLV